MSSSDDKVALQGALKGLSLAYARTLDENKKLSRELFVARRQAAGLRKAVRVLAGREKADTIDAYDIIGMLQGIK